MCALHFTEYLYQRLQLPGILQHHQCVSGTAGTEGERWKKKMNLESFTLYSPLTLHYCSIVITMLEIVFFVVYNLRILCMHVCM